MTDVIRQVGTANAVDADRVQARVRLSECDNLRINWLSVLQRNTQDNKDYWLPDVGKQVEVLLSASGEGGVILGAVYSDVDKPPFSDKNIRGARFADDAEYGYNQKARTLIIRSGVEYIVVECGADVVLKTQEATTSAPETELTGDLCTRGELIYEGDMADSGGKGVIATIHGNIEIKGNARATDSVLSNDENSSHHSH